mmetsp:Transcript_9660/g.17409  ORF Transcript_9660/g.17409 Transcript_9660/m.17409 type:complete len:82 (+) Transcript_9660:123-368(+)
MNDLFRRLVKRKRRRAHIIGEFFLEKEVGEEDILGSQNSHAEHSNSYLAMNVIPYISILPLISIKFTVQADQMYPMLLCSA